MAKAPVQVPPGRVWLNPDEPDDDYPMFATTAVPPKKPGTVRVWVDGCFDMLHFGHANAIRQARALGHELFVGSHSDEEVIRYKGPPIMTADERYEALRACKWVDFVVENYPYCTRLKDIERFEVDFVVHGDDISTDLSGRNSYQDIIDAGRFKVVKRTEGISTTDLVGRMLLCTKGHFKGEEVDSPLIKDAKDPSTNLRYLTTSRKIAQFSNQRTPSPDDKIVYVDGAFDLFHIAHMRILEAARKFGTFVIVGIHEDAVVNEHKGSNYPIMNLNERVLGVLSCRWVDEVVMGVPFHVSEELMKSLNVDVVVAGGIYEEVAGDVGRDPYAVPRKLGKLQVVKNDCKLTTGDIIDRVIKAREAFVARQAAKLVKDKKVEEAKPEEFRNVREVA